MNLPCACDGFDVRDVRDVRDVHDVRDVRASQARCLSSRGEACASEAPTAFWKLALRSLPLLLYHNNS